MLLRKADLKNTTDDALPNYLASLGFKENHQLIDVRLALGYTAVAISAALFGADWKYGWEVTKDYTLPAVILYFCINGILSGWILAVEKGQVFRGTTEGKTLSITSSVRKHSPIYHISVNQKSGVVGSETLTLSAPFTRWFDDQGVFTSKPFQQWLATEVSLIGDADPKNREAFTNGESSNLSSSSARSNSPGMSSSAAFIGGQATSPSLSRKTRRF